MIHLRGRLFTGGLDSYPLPACWFAPLPLLHLENETSHEFHHFFCVASMALVTSLDAKPLKVFILAGQSNMEGHAQTMTFPATAKDPKTADIHKKISNQGFHYHGSAKFFAQDGKAFAEALVDLNSRE